MAKVVHTLRFCVLSFDYLFLLENMLSLIPQYILIFIVCDYIFIVKGETLPDLNAEGPSQRLGVHEGNFSGN